MFTRILYALHIIAMVLKGKNLFDNQDLFRLLMISFSLNWVHW